MIRLATGSDLVTVTDLVIEFLQSTSYGNHVELVEREHIMRIAYTALHQGYIWLYYHNQVPVGVLIAVRERNTWIPSKITLRELVWYVREEFRRSVGAGRLFKVFCEQGDELLEQGLISGYFTTRMTTTDNYDLERRGFRMTESLYLKDE